MELRPIYVLRDQRPFKIIEIVWYKEQIIPQKSEWGRLKKLSDEIMSMLCNTGTNFIRWWDSFVC